MAEHAHVHNLATSTTGPTPATSVTALPILKFTQRALLDLGQRTSTSLNHITRVVEFDPNLAVSLLLAVNRDLDTQGRESVAGISRAVLIFGTSRFLEQAQSFTTIEETLNGTSQYALRMRLARSYLAGRLACALAGLARGHSHDDVFATAVCSDAAKYAKKLIAVTSSKLGVRHFSLYLPGLQDNTAASDDVLQLVAIARKYAKQVTDCWDDSALIPIYDQAAELCGREPEEIERVLKRTSIEAARCSRHFNCRLAATNLMSPGPKPATLQAPGPRADVAPPQTQLPQTQLPENSTPLDDRLVRALSSPPENVYSIDECRRRVARALRDLEKIGFSDGGRARVIPYVLQTMSAILPIEHAMFLTNDKRGQLSARIKLSADQQPIACNIAIDRLANPFVERVISDNTAHKFNTRSEETLNGEIDNTLSRFIGEDVGYFFPMVVGRPFGLIIAKVDRELDRQDFTYFELFLALATQATKSIGLATARAEPS